MNYLKEGVNLVAFLVGGFGGFLTNISPPEDGISFILGISLLTGVMLYLVVLSIKTMIKKSTKVKIISIGVAVTTFFVFLYASFDYSKIYDQYVFDYDENLYVGCGDKESALTDSAKSKLESGTYDDANDIVTSNALFRIQDTWKAEELKKCKSQIKFKYFISLSLFFSSVFIITILVLEDKNNEDD